MAKERIDQMRIDHITLNTRDLQKMDDFLTKVLLLEETARPKFDFDGRWYLVPHNQAIHVILTEKDIVDKTHKEDWPIDHISFSLPPGTYVTWDKHLDSVFWSNDEPIIDFSFRGKRVPDFNLHQIFINYENLKFELNFKDPE
jgi:catechol 2,3-dioxygenase-like lactoylglutathione lyase family enzyme